MQVTLTGNVFYLEVPEMKKCKYVNIIIVQFSFKSQLPRSSMLSGAALELRSQLNRSLG